MRRAIKRLRLWFFICTQALERRNKWRIFYYRTIGWFSRSRNFFDFCIFNLLEKFFLMFAEWEIYWKFFFGIFADGEKFWIWGSGSKKFTVKLPLIFAFSNLKEKIFLDFYFSEFWAKKFARFLLLDPFYGSARSRKSTYCTVNL